MKRISEAGIEALHLFVLCGFAFAQPLFDLLSRNAEFFVVRRSESVDILLLVAILCLGLPLILIGVERMAGLFGPRVRQGVHSIAIACLTAIILLPALKHLGNLPGPLLVAGAVLLGGAVATGYGYFSAVRTFITILSPGLLLFPGLFLFYSPVFGLVFPWKHPTVAFTNITATAPVVIVVFDELPVTSLMDEQRKIDSLRYPHFAALAQDATWFRNATAVSETTTLAVPPIVSGLYPNQPRLPTAADYPHTLFTLLGGSHAMNVFESQTMMCPEILCGEKPPPLPQGMRSMLSDLAAVYLHIVLPADLTSRLPVVTQTWNDFWSGIPRTLNIEDVIRKRQASSNNRPQLFIQFVESIAAAEKPTLYFLHILLPHMPWEYLPSGKRYSQTAMELEGLDLQAGKWSQDERLVIQSYQRHLLQVGFVDTLLGKLLHHLTAVGLYDPSLIVVTADHGTSFHPGENPRVISQANFPDVMSVPLFIKAPHQRQGRISDRPIETVDILPTIADILEIGLPWPVDGYSGVDPSLPERTKKMMFSVSGDKFVYDVSAFEAKYETLERKLAFFGSGKDPNDLFKTGPHIEIIGRRVSDIGVAGQADVKISIDRADLFTAVNLDGDFVPASITGQVEAHGERAAPLHIAVAIEGTIYAITQARSVAPEYPITWAVVVPERAFHPGRNTIETFIVSLSDGKPSLQRATTDTLAYVLAEPDTDGREMIMPSTGSPILVIPEALDGWVDRAEIGKEYAIFDGWAADVQHAQLPATIVIFANGKSVYSGKTSVGRLDVAISFNNPLFAFSGFHHSFPSALLGPTDNPIIRVFALSKKGGASELHYLPEFRQGLAGPGMTMRVREE